jgi:hypothetical protein
MLRTLLAALLWLHACRLNEQVQQLLGSQAKLLQARTHAATKHADEQQGYQEHGCSPLQHARAQQRLTYQQQQQQSPEQHSQSAGVITTSSRECQLGNSMQDFELQLQQLQLQVDNMQGEAAIEQADAAAATPAAAFGLQGLCAAKLPLRCSQTPAQQVQEQQQLIDDQAATITDLKKVIAGKDVLTCIMPIKQR